MDQSKLTKTYACYEQHRILVSRILLAFQCFVVRISCSSWLHFIVFS